LEAFAKKVAEETAAKIAMKQAEQKAAEVKAVQEAEEKAAADADAKALQAEEVKSAIQTGVESGAEKLLSDMQEKLSAKEADMGEILAQYKKDLEEKSEEIQKMRESKRVFADRAEQSDITKWGQDFLNAHMLGVMTQKGWNTDFAQNVQQKAGIDYATNAGDIDQEVSRLIEKEIMNELKVARLFREIPVNGKSTVLPIQVDVDPASWATNATSGNLENRGASNATYQPKQVILNAYRLISSTFMDNEVDEQTLINLMPMLVEGVARAHGRAVEAAFLLGNGTISGLDGHGSASAITHDISGNGAAGVSFNTMTGADLLNARKEMGKYGLNPSDVTFIVSQNMYYDLLSDSAFQSLDEVGTELAIKVTGTVGAVFGSPVIVSEEFAAEGAGVPVAFAVYARNYVAPRLRGVTVEQDYEVMNQRRVIVATQSLGFNEIVAGAGTDQPCIKIDSVA